MHVVLLIYLKFRKAADVVLCEKSLVKTSIV